MSDDDDNSSALFCLRSLLLTGTHICVYIYYILYLELHDHYPVRLTALLTVSHSLSIATYNICTHARTTARCNM